MRSIINSSHKARYSSAFSVEIFVKNYICGAYHRILNGTSTDFLRSNILNKISSKDLPMVCFVVTQHSETERFR